MAFCHRRRSAPVTELGTESLVKVGTGWERLRGLSGWQEYPVSIRGLNTQVHMLANMTKIVSLGPVSVGECIVAWN